VALPGYQMGCLRNDYHSWALLLLANVWKLCEYIPFIIQQH